MRVIQESMQEMFLAPLVVMDKMNDTGCITLASCSENQESNPYPEQEQGVFTYYLCEEIKNTEKGTPIYIEQLKLKGKGYKACNGA